MSENKPPKHDLDLIQMVQQARMMHDAGTKPSGDAGVYWIEVKSAAPHTPAPTAHSGQWEIDLSIDVADAVWQKVKTVTEAGQLGYKSKISTSSRDQRNPNARTLAIRTYDSRDAADVARVKTALLDLGIQGDWRYVPDAAS